MQRKRDGPRRIPADLCANGEGVASCDQQCPSEQGVLPPGGLLSDSARPGPLLLGEWDEMSDSRIVWSVGHR